MKAAIHHKYGPPSALRLEEVATPVPRAGEALVRVHAASVNAADLDLLRGRFMVRPGGLFRPRYRILGSDIAGVVESVGPDVTGLRPGDEVFGDLTEFGFGAFAEFVSVPAAAVTGKPAGLSFDQAAAVPSAGGVALLNLRAFGPIEPGQSVLINGAGGGMGTFAVQIAKAAGAEITGADSAEKLEMIRSIGADHVLDYAKNDFAQNGTTYDRIIDLVAFRSVYACKKVLNPTGVYLAVGGSVRRMLQVAMLGPVISKADGKMLGMVMEYPNITHLEGLRELIEDGKVVPVIDRDYPLEEVGEALRHLESGRVRGKVVISVDREGE